jgi:hypothetical protein
MGVNVRWFNRTRCEYVDPLELGINNRWSYVDGPKAIAFYVLVQEMWNGAEIWHADEIKMCSDNEDAFYTLVDEERYANVSAKLLELLRWHWPKEFPSQI